MGPMRKCNHVSCRTLIPFDRRYCEAHTHHRRATDKAYNDERLKNNPEYIRFYGSREWKSARRLALMRDDFMCVACKREGKFIPAEVVDHIIDTKEAWHRRLDQSNLQSLCF